MIGHNTIEMCQAEAAHAIETYLNDHVFQCNKQVKVTKVEYHLANQSDGFIISIQEKEEED